jgi:hypothetical protein
VESFNDPLTGSPVSVSTINGQESVSLGTSPSQTEGIAGFLGSPAVSTAVNLGLSAAMPSYGLANLGVMGLTGTSIYGQGVSLATGQGLQTGGGLIGAMSGSSPLGQGEGPVGVGEGGGGGDGDSYGSYYVPVQTADQAMNTVQQSPRPVLQPISYPSAQFVPQAAQPVQIVQYAPLPIPQPARVAYGTPYAPRGPGIPSVPSFFSRPSGTTQFYG